MVNHEYSEDEHDAHFEAVDSGVKVFHFIRPGYDAWVRKDSVGFELVHKHDGEDEWRTGRMRTTALKGEQRRLNYDVCDPDKFPEPEVPTDQ